MAQFSGAVKLADLNDFIAPSQACVVNINASGKAQVQLDFSDFDIRPEVGAVQPQQRPAVGFQQTAPTGPNGAIKVTLQDCLACSGCVTSAETILLEHQSAEEFVSKLAQPDTTVLVSVSPQSRAALAAYYGLSSAETMSRLSGFFKGLGVKAVLDTNTGRDIALLEAAAEFLERYKAAHPGPEQHENGIADMEVEERRMSGHKAGTTGRADGSTGQNGHASGHALAAGRQQQQGRSTLPMLASACPGWVCYAEKSHGDTVLPFISTTRSPQAVMGQLLKGHLAHQWGVNPASIYHCAVMPCYDKKLEASREDFNLPGTKIPEVDSVLTSGEVQQLLQSHGRPLPAIAQAPLDTLVPGVQDDPRLYGIPGGSGGYLQYIFRTAARELYGIDVPWSEPLPLRVLRNADFREVTLEHDGRAVLRFALAYGFRNIQTIVRKMKRKSCEYDYVEVMACPSGCLNGGGQLKAGQGQSQQQLLDQLDAIYHDPEVQLRLPEQNPTVAALYSAMAGAGVGSEGAKRLFHTGYHKREKTLTQAAGDW
ncbi:hypothetical protein CVIRNUC_005508 [Coccomyxa viridis]|uniref:Iron hydrogenase small subunit domain-containing protein n=1 Tax=Coccomyxa viridis TaxID=1274662 RepID=A0AAV1I8P8_9CHLO|nr:hypothetical protein CVIRNUC_005508 [Coccomyxa viridis]